MVGLNFLPSIHLFRLWKNHKLSEIWYDKRNKCSSDSYHEYLSVSDIQAVLLSILESLSTETCCRNVENLTYFLKCHYASGAERATMHEGLYEWERESPFVQRGTSTGASIVNVLCIQISITRRWGLYSGLIVCFEVNLHIGQKSRQRNQTKQ